MVNADGVSTSRRIRVREIVALDIERITDLLARGFPVRSHAFWREALARLARHATPPGFPQFGYVLEDGDVPAGVILLISTQMSTAPASVRCNVSSWYVDPHYRGYAPFLSARALSRKDVTYLNITPAPHTRPIALAQGYLEYSAGTFVAMPMLNLFSAGGRIDVFNQERHLTVTPFERDLLLKHAQYGCMSLWAETGTGGVPLVFRARVVKRVNCAQLIYCRDVGDLVRCAGPVGRYLAMRGMLLVLVDANGPIPGLVGKYLAGRMPRFFRGPERPRLGDLAFTEAAIFGV